ncbi:pyruvate ferredoxin oxidoreductase [Thermococcus sp. MV5]|uniref:2-oxoacid:acceptor oxidoreductase family protein n=1 Tax=Thermococcus sp. MV5 TaxID=1638272 RepID=UPI00143A2AD0|nr:2-oxoacid:acceptor oxidoreductase family protein [Thermococcus sp. MV5]NJE26181.1 pyruvate ferredoxin oxidoreductase [Thermococcus sp. MV5]
MSKSRIGESLKEIRLHGRGGQGVVLCSELIAQAALYDGNFTRSFPWFGIARRGAPVTSFVVIGEANKIVRSMVYNPKYVVVLDPHLHKVMPEVTGNIKEGGVYIQNSTKNPTKLLKELKLSTNLSIIATVDATGLAMEYMGASIPNIAMLGAFAKVTNLITFDSAMRAIKVRFPENVWERYLKCFEAGYEKVYVKVLENEE